MKTLPTVGALALAAVLFGGGQTQPAAETPASALTPPGSCKPGGPVEIAVDLEVAAGAVAVDFSLSPVVDLLDLEVEVELPEGARLLQLSAPRGPQDAGARSEGFARFELPDAVSSAANLVVRAVVFDPVTGETADLRSVAALVERTEPLELPVVQVAGETVRVLPAVRRGGSPR